jgi:hypothetical protein
MRMSTTLQSDLANFDCTREYLMLLFSGENRENMLLEPEIISNSMLDYGFRDIEENIDTIGDNRMKKIILTMLLSVFLLSTMTVPALAQYDWDVGIKVGDWFKYKGTLHLWEGDAFPPLLLEVLQTWNASDWMEYTVTDIEEFIVTFEVTTHWKDGTETVDTLEEDMMNSMNPMVIGANLTEGTEIRPETEFLGYPVLAKFLNASVMREYESGSRETNVLTYTDDVLGNYIHQEYLFDKETGIRVYYQSNATDVVDITENRYSYIATFELIETNVENWIVIPEFLTGTVMLLVFVAVTVCVEVYRRKKLKGHIG